MPESGLLGYPGNGTPVDLDPNTQLFVSSGTWTKPADCEWIRIICVGGGGGGGGGRRNNTSRPSGGAGGGGGAISFLDVPASLLPNNVTITVGAGGAGGNGATSANSNGTGGSSGGATSFGTFLTANGGSGGASSDTSTVATGGQGHLYGGDGGYNNFSNADQPFRYFGTSGGGAGGGQTDQQVPNAGSCGLVAVSPFLEPQKYGLIGAGGNGGSLNRTGTSAFSSTAGTFGNGGGGGGGGKSSNNGGNGSAGGNGYCLIVGYGSRFRPFNVQEFKTDGTWIKPNDPRLTTARVFAIGGGGGGGSGRRWNRLNGGYLTGTELALSMNSANYASVPDAAGLDITGDLDIQVKCAFTSWGGGQYILNGGNSTDYTLLSKWTDAFQRCYLLSMSGMGVPSLYLSTTGADVIAISATDSINLAQDTVKWVRATIDVNNGASQRVTKFYTSDDGTTWTQLGSTITTSGAITIFSGTPNVNIGAHNNGTSARWEGFFYRAIIKDGYDGAGNTVLDVNFETATAGATTFTESSTNAYTVTINSTTTASAGGGAGQGGRVSYAELPLATLPTTVDVTVGAGGTGAAGLTTDYRNGTAGSNGGATSFGSFLQAQGGFGGFGGTSAAGIAGGLSLGSGWGGLSGGSAGGNGSTGTGGTGATTTIAGSFMTSGGGGGGGISAAGATASGGASTKSQGYGSAISNTSATANGTELFPDGTGMFGSTGGGGGSSNGTVAAGNGGRGAGGGGGAATTTGTTSGAGGNGGTGYLLVVSV